MDEEPEKRITRDQGILSSPLLDDKDQSLSRTRPRTRCAPPLLIFIAMEVVFKFQD
jgi:hypothetical protein